MAAIFPIRAITYDTTPDVDLLPVIAPPYDVLDEAGKEELLARNDRNIVAVDLPHLPAKTVGPDATYERAGETFRQWLEEGDLIRRRTPALFVYQQTYTIDGKRYRRRGLFANIALQDFGKSPDGKGGVYPHEQTFSGPKEDRLKLMRATKAQLSPIFGLHNDPAGDINNLLANVIEANDSSFYGTTSNDSVLHEVWVVEDDERIVAFQSSLADADVFIADGHHRYNTALNYRNELIEQQGQLPADHPANQCMFVLVSMTDPGMIVLPTHRVLGGMRDFSFGKLTTAAKGKLQIRSFEGDIEALEKELSKQEPHAMGLVWADGDADGNAGQPKLAVATTVDPDPLHEDFAEKSDAWRQLDVAVLQHLIVERICEPHFCDEGEHVTWKFPHSLSQLEKDVRTDGYQLGVILQPTPLESVRKVSEAGELMPQKSTFFYPKLATGLVIHPLE